MATKDLIRKKYFHKRKKNYFEIDKSFFNPLIKLLKKKIKDKTINLAIYFPSSYELNILKIIDIDFFKNVNLLLPVVDENKGLKFYKWKNKDVLNVNKFGILEPLKEKVITPNVALVPLLSFDKNNNRLGYGKGFYDRYLNKHNELKKNILTIGVAFFFQKHHNLPVNKKDFKLDYIITEKGIFK